MSMKRIIIALALLFAAAFAPAQNKNVIDSLINKLSTPSSDTARINTLNALSANLYANDPTKSLTYSEEAIKLADKAGDDKGMSIALSMAGNAYYYLGNFDSSLVNYLRSLKLKEKTNDKKGMAKLSANAAMIYDIQGNYSEAMKYLLRSLSISEKEGDKNGMAAAYNSIGNLYRNRKDLQKALSYYKLALRTAKEVNDLKVQALAAGNMGNVYFQQKLYPDAIGYYTMAMKISEQRNDIPGKAKALSGIGGAYGMQGDLEKAKENYEKALEIHEQVKNIVGMGECLKNLGDVHSMRKEPRKAIEYYNRALELNEQMKYKEGMKNVYESLALVYAETGDYKEAYRYSGLVADLKDTLLNEQNSKQMNEMATRYETEKKEQQIVILQKDKALSDADLAQQKFTRNSLIVFSSLILVLVGLIYRSYHNKKKANTLLAIQKREIDDSINYALQIQKATLPDPADIEKAFPEVFGLYLPKDVVSGDFYWFAKKDSKAIIAAVDCTGHGVPGAFMSMIGSDKLNAAVIEKNITRPANILSEVNSTVKRALKQNSSESKSRDGMDMALCTFDLEKNILEYAGANRPLVHIRNGELHEISPTKASIGGHTPDGQEFDNHIIETKKNDTFYIFSDGYADQFGGAQGKKFMTKKLKQALLSIQQLSMKEQEKALYNTFLEWKGRHEQIDDILVIGIRI
jgi:tetratricopeptide (TPR) repeat protein